MGLSRHQKQATRVREVWRHRADLRRTAHGRGLPLPRTIPVTGEAQGRTAWLADGERWKAAWGCRDQKPITLGRVGGPLQPAPALDSQGSECTSQARHSIPAQSPPGREGRPPDLGGAGVVLAESNPRRAREETAQGRPEGRTGGGRRLPRPAPGSGRGACPRAAADPALLDACRDDPARFHEEVLGRRLWSKQVAVCKEIARSPVTVVPAGRAVGKSFLLAGTVLWWLYTRPDEPGDHHRARPPPGGLGALEGDPPGASAPVRAGTTGSAPGSTSAWTISPRVTPHPSASTVKMGTDWGALGFAAQYEEGFSGQHAGELLVIVDEASGVTPPIWSAIHGLAASRLVVVGNPIRYDCHFRELHDLAVKGSTTIRSVGISSLEVARCQEGFLSRRHGVAFVPEPDARDSRRGIAVVAVEHPRHLPGSGVGAIPADGLARRLHAGERARR